MIKYKNEMKEYLYNHNYVSENKKSNYQQELSVERAECIINKHNSIMEDEKQQLISFLEEKIKEYKLNIFNLKYNIGTTYEEIGKYKGSLQAFQKVLDFVNKGGNGETK